MTTQEKEAIAAKAACPISENIAGFEDIEWDVAYAFNLTKKEFKDLPRILLVGDSICNGYQTCVRNKTNGIINVSFWASSKTVCNPDYLAEFALRLEMTPLDIVHFNNGLHSTRLTDEQYAKGLEDAFDLIETKCPKAKIVWVSSTPYENPERNKRVIELNAIAAAIAKRRGYQINDLYTTAANLDVSPKWADGVHFLPPTVEVLAQQVADVAIANR